MRRMPAIVLAVSLLAAASCSSERTFTEQQIPKLVLGEADAPKGLQHDAESSGFQTLEQYAENEDKREAFRKVGFKTSYFSLFVSRSLPPKPNQAATQTTAISFAMLFRTPAGARAGLNVLERSLRDEGVDMQRRSAEQFGANAFGLGGVFDAASPGKPYGYCFAWQTGNAIFGVLADGPKGEIGEPAVRQLATIVQERTEEG